jgi:hypothetical protein
MPSQQPPLTPALPPLGAGAFVIGILIQLSSLSKKVYSTLIPIKVNE